MMPASLELSMLALARMQNDDRRDASDEREMKWKLKVEGENGSGKMKSVVVLYFGI